MNFNQSLTRCPLVSSFKRSKKRSSWRKKFFRSVNLNLRFETFERFFSSFESPPESTFFLGSGKAKGEEGREGEDKGEKGERAEEKRIGVGAHEERARAMGGKRARGKHAGNQKARPRVGSGRRGSDCGKGEGEGEGAHVCARKGRGEEEEMIQRAHAKKRACAERALAGRIETGAAQCCDSSAAGEHKMQRRGAQFAQNHAGAVDERGRGSGASFCKWNGICARECDRIFRSCFFIVVFGTDRDACACARTSCPQTCLFAPRALLPGKCRARRMCTWLAWPSRLSATKVRKK